MEVGNFIAELESMHPGTYEFDKIGTNEFDKMVFLSSRLKRVISYIGIERSDIKSESKTHENAHSLLKRFPP